MAGKAIKETELGMPLTAAVQKGVGEQPLGSSVDIQRK